jgi:hypothetical protein
MQTDWLLPKPTKQCIGFDATRFYQLLNADKSNVMNGNGIIVGNVLNNKIRSVKCKHNTTANLCSECLNLQKQLNIKLQNIPEILNNVKSGRCPSFSSVIAYPHIMFNLIHELTSLISNIPKDKYEIELLSAYREARGQYNSYWGETSKEIISTSIDNIRTTHNPPTETNPTNIVPYKPFQETFFMKFISNQLQNFSRSPTHHIFDNVLKRFWVCSRFFSGKQFFERMGGNKNKKVPVNWKNHLQYNIIMPSLSSMQKWMPRLHWFLSIFRIHF